MARFAHKDVHLHHSHVAFLDRKRGKRPRISDNADDDPPGPVVAVKHAKRIPFSNDEVQHIKVFMEGHGGKGAKVYLHLCREFLESHKLDRTP